MRIALILNSTAGALRTLDVEQVSEDIAHILRRHGHEVEVELHAGGAAIEAIDRVCKTGKFDAIVVGGGDGTVSAAAGRAALCGATLGILPLGTMNLFARSLGMPLEIKAAAEALADGETQAIDIGEVNGRFFVHLVSLGLHPRMIRIRERIRYGSRFGKMWASVQAWWLVVRQPPRLSVSIETDGVVTDARTVALLVSNNPLGEGHLPYADDLRHGTLGIYVATSRRWRDLLALAVRAVLGELSSNPFLEFWEAKQVEIRLSESIVAVSADGEVMSLPTPLRLRVRERALRVLRPRSAIAREAATARAERPQLRVVTAQ
jgi:diacylglycerol kinase family enzyme